MKLAMKNSSLLPPLLALLLPTFGSSFLLNTGAATKTARALVFPTTVTKTTKAFLPTADVSSSAARVAQSQHQPRLYATPPSSPSSPSSDTRTEEIERLRTMAAKLRAEASALEAEQAQQLAEATRKAFNKFDTNQDGEIGVQELKVGLEKALKKELSEDRVKTLLEQIDTSGDGALQLDEFVTVEQLRNKLDAIVRDEKALALEKAKAAKMEEEAVKFVQAQMDLINDRPPTTTDKIVSVLPYLFPLLDGLQFARFLVLENPDNPVAALIAILYGLYRSIPLGGFIAFFALSSLSGNPTINRLIRFNMQQAIFLDIALFFPGLIAGVYSLIAKGLGFELPVAATEIGSDVLFFTLVLTIGYATVSSLLGQAPDKIPFISDAVNSRMPTIDMFDEYGHLKQNKKTDDKDDDNKTNGE